MGLGRLACNNNNKTHERNIVVSNGLNFQWAMARPPIRWHVRKRLGLLFKQKESMNEMQNNDTR